MIKVETRTQTIISIFLIPSISELTSLASEVDVLTTKKQLDSHDHMFTKPLERRHRNSIATKTRNKNRKNKHADRRIEIDRTLSHTFALRNLKDNMNFRNDSFETIESLHVSDSERSFERCNIQRSYSSVSWNSFLAPNQPKKEKNSFKWNDQVADMPSRYENIRIMRED